MNDHPPYQLGRHHRTPKVYYPRSRCCISGCRHTSTLFESEWMCAGHWRMLGKAQRRVLRRIWRLIEKVGRPLDRNWQPTLGHLRAREYRCWTAAKRHVIEAQGAL